MQELIERTYRPFEELLAREVANAHARRVLDVGCGSGSTTIAAARAAGVTGHCTGIDISAPMIAAATARAEGEGTAADFILADAQTHTFEPEQFDMIVSRFGVMFFDDPAQAFTNLRRAAMADANMRLIAWRSPAENPFMTTAERAAAPLLPNLPPRRPGAPGQFAFADSDRVAGILEQSGWRAIDIQPLDVECSFPATELANYFTRLGPLGMTLHEADGPTLTRIIEVVRAAFDPFVHGTEVHFTAACWMIRAHA